VTSLLDQWLPCVSSCRWSLLHATTDSSNLLPAHDVSHGCVASRPLQVVVGGLSSCTFKFQHLQKSFLAAGALFRVVQLLTCNSCKRYQYGREAASMPARLQLSDELRFPPSPTLVVTYLHRRTFVAASHSSRFVTVSHCSLVIITPGQSKYCCKSRVAIVNVEACSFYQRNMSSFS